MPAARSPAIVLIALFVTLIPTTIGALLSAIGIAGMDRLVKFNVLAMSGRSVEAAGDVDTLLLDKTGTITLGNRLASELIALKGVDRARAGGRGAACLLQRRDAGGPLDRGAGQGKIRPARPRDGADARAFVPFTAQTRMSGVESTAQIRKGAVDSVIAFLKQRGMPGDPAGDHRGQVGRRIHRQEGGTPLAVAEDAGCWASCI